MGGGTFFEVGGTSARQKNVENFCRVNWQLTSQASKYDVISYTPREGINYTILDKITPLENVSLNHLKFK